MPSNYTGNPAAIFLTISLLDDGDKRTVASFRPALERIIDSLANLDPRVTDALTKSAGGTLAGTITVSSTGRITFQSGSGLGVQSGASINVASGGIVALASGGEITIADGAEILIADQSGLAGLVLTKSSGLKILSEVCNWRSMLCPQWISLRTVAGVGVPAWDDNDEVGTGGGSWYLNDTSGLRIIRFPLNRLPGDIVSQIQVSLKGGAGAGHGSSLPASMPRVKLVKVSGAGVRSVIADAVDGSASAAAYDVSHVVTLNDSTDTLGTHLMPFTVTGDPLYVEIHGEHGANAVDSTLRLNSIFGQSVSVAVRGAVEFT